MPSSVLPGRSPADGWCVYHDAIRRGLSSDYDFKTNETTYPFAIHACVVEIDLDSGEIKSRRYLGLDDCGRFINPLLAEGQVNSGFAQGVGRAPFEREACDDTGNLATGTVIDNAMPRVMDFPTFETLRTETPTPASPLGVKAIGEAAPIGATPSVISVVVDALSPLGVEHPDMPLLPEKVWRALGRRSS